MIFLYVVSELPSVYAKSVILSLVLAIGMIQDLKRLALEQLVAVGESCMKSSTSHCSEIMCAREGLCTEGWNRPVCDCVNTPYTGKQCEQG